MSHDVLGKGDAACLVCHDDPAKNPGMLKLADGSLVDIKGDVAAVCFRCHSTKYKEWKAGTHGKHQGKCTAAGCHDPHSPGFMYAQPLRPFVGNGFQFQVLSERTAFTPLMAPAPPPARALSRLVRGRGRSRRCRRRRSDGEHRHVRKVDPMSQDSKPMTAPEGVHPAEARRARLGTPPRAPLPRTARRSRAAASSRAWVPRQAS